MDAVADILSPGNAAALIGLAFLALAALPLVLALRYGFRVAVLAALITAKLHPWLGCGRRARVPFHKSF
jgi:thiamine transporter ThiT